MKKAQIIKTIIFVLVFVLLFQWVSGVLVAKWRDHNCETDVMREFYAIEKNTIDVAIIGSSQVVAGACPIEMYEDYGISAYALGTSNQNLFCSYYWLKECLRRQDISTLVLDVSMLYVREDAASMRKAMDNMRFSKNKMEMILAQRSLKNAQSSWTYIFNIMKYHTRWKELEKEDFSRKEENKIQYRGGVLFTGLEPQNYNRICIDGDNPSDSQMVDYELEYFKKILTLCEEEGIDVLLIKTPKANWNLTKHEGASALAAEANLPFLDFNTGELLRAIRFDMTADMKDMDHLNIRGAAKMSGYIAKYLVEHYEMKDRRKEGLISEGYLDQYHDKLRESYMISNGDVANYFTYLKNENYDVIISGSSNLIPYWTHEMQLALSEYGITQDYRTLEGNRFVWHISGGVCQYQQTANNSVLYEGAFRNGLGFSVTNEDVTQLLFDDREQRINNGGVNVFIYDNRSQKIIDRAYIYYNNAFATLRVKHDYVVD